MASSEVPVLELPSIGNPFSDASISKLESLLPQYIAARRWFRAKARTIQKAQVEDVIPTGEKQSYVLVIRLDYTAGHSDLYVVAVALGQITFGNGVADKRPPAGADVIATYRTGDGSEGNIYEALSNEAFRDFMLEAIACSRSFRGRTGELSASRTVGWSEDYRGSGMKLKTSVSRAEQSNTSIIYGDRFILKLFRKIEPGINPDIEIGTFLTERGFRHTPRVLGNMEYRKSNGTVYATAILQEFVRNQGDAWAYTLDSLAGFFGRVLGGNTYAPVLESYHPMQIALKLAEQEIAPDIREKLGEYADSAHLLGRRTAEMHAALADGNAGPDFAPEPFTPADGDQLQQEMAGQADIAFELLRRKQAVLTETAAADASLLLRMEQQVLSRFQRLRDHAITTARIRTHGDYHLGQVLYTGSDFMIIDFEGEPARPLAERRSKTLAMRDVAGMIRSFQYAAYAALFDQAPGDSMDPDTRSKIESWSAFWSAWSSAIYLRGYFGAVKDLPFVSAGANERRTLLDSFLLQKALYEVAYELNNRPDWVRIPLRGILSLVS